MTTVILYLKEMVKELNTPIIALSQLFRDVEKRRGDKRPLPSELREFGSLEQDADYTIFLWRGEYYKIAEYDDGNATADTVLFDVDKHRNGLNLVRRELAYTQYSLIMLDCFQHYARSTVLIFRCLNLI